MPTIYRPIRSGIFFSIMRCDFSGWMRASLSSNVHVSRFSLFGINLHSAKIKSLARSVYRVYVVELSKRVFTEDWKFRAANPQFNGVLECLYVGMTSKTPAERFKQQKT